MIAHPTGTEFSVMGQVADVAIRNLAVAGGVGLALFLFRARQSSTRLSVWKAVLYVSLAMPLLSWLVPALPVQMPLLLQEQIDGLKSAPVGDVRRVSEGNSEPSVVPAHATPAIDVTAGATAEFGPTPISHKSERASSHFWAAVEWARVAFWIYLIVAALLLARLVAGMILARRLVTNAKRISDPEVAERMRRTAGEYGVQQIPSALASDRVAVPLTCGTIHPAILFPSNWERWSDEKLEAVIAHEMSHVARGDAFTQSLALVHRALFWFSPLAWWLDRQLANLAEQASDEAALSRGADRNAYARALLDFFQAVQMRPGRVRWQGVAMAQAGQTEQRLERILAWKGAVPMGAKKSVVLAFMVFAIPVLYLAAAVRPSDGVSGQEPAKAMVTATPSKAPVAAAASATPAPAVAAVSGVPVPAPPAAVGQAPAAPEAEISDSEGAGRAVSFHGSGYSYAYGYDDEQRFVIVSGKTDSLTMSGSSEDARHAEKLKKTIPGDFIWFERDEKSYIIQDPATIERARKLWAPQEELGKKQEELGKQQEELGKQQEALGKKMEEVRVQVPDMTAELDKLKAELKALSSGATVEQVGNLQSEIGELQSKIGEIQSHAGEEQSKLGEEMGALGEKQGKLGEEQGKLGEQQGELAHKAVREMRTLLDEAIKNGKAKPEPEGSSGASL